jgi:hypothetical protein
MNEAIEDAIESLSFGARDLDLRSTELDGPDAAFLFGLLTMNTSVTALNLASEFAQGAACQRARAHDLVAVAGGRCVCQTIRLGCGARWRSRACSA